MQKKPITEKRTDELMNLEDHIKTCKQCQNNPYNPCAEGKAIITGVIENASEISKSRTVRPQMKIFTYFAR